MSYRILPFFYFIPYFCANSKYTQITMKNLLLLIAIISAGFVSAQITSGGGGDFAGSGESTKFINAGKNGFATTFVNPKRPVIGTNYLFDDWKNKCIIVTNDNNKYVIRNVNLNIKRNTFEAKIDGDSLFIFNFNNIKRFEINEKSYKNYYWDDDNRVYQVIFESPDFTIIKGFKITEVVGSANPMLNRSRDKLIRKEFIFLKTDDGIVPFRLAKSKILKLFVDDEGKRQKLQDYVRSNNLSYKKEEDVQQMLEFIHETM